MPDVTSKILQQRVVSTITGASIIRPLVTAATAAATAAETAQGLAETAQEAAEAAALDASTQVAQVIDILGRADLYEMDRTYDATQFLSRGIELLFTEDYYRLGSEVHDDITDLTGFACTRSTVGYALRANGTYQSFGINEPRITDKGITVEPAATNLLLRSNEFDNASWLKTNCTIATNVATAPDGTATADRLIPNTSVVNSHQITQAPALADNTDYVLSVFVKAGGYDFLALVPTNKAGASTSSIFNISTGVVASVDPLHTAGIDAFAGGWFRCWVKFNSGAGATSPILRIRSTADASGTPFAGDGVSGPYIWSSQLEAGALCSTPIVTTGAAATRPADWPRITGLSFSGAFVVYIEYEWIGAGPSDGGTRVLFELSDAAGTSLLRFYNSPGNNVRSFLQVGGVSQGILTAPGGAGAARTTYEAASRVSVSNHAIGISGGRTDASGDVLEAPALTQMGVGSLASNANQSSAILKRLALIPVDLADAAFDALTAA